MGVVDIREGETKAAITLDKEELQQTVSLLHSAVSSLGSERPVELARLWSLAAAASRNKLPVVEVVTPSAAALKQRLVLQRQSLAIHESPPLDHSKSLVLQPTPPSLPIYTHAADALALAPSPSLALASRGFGQSLEEAFAGLGRVKDGKDGNALPRLEALPIAQVGEQHQQGTASGACKLRRLPVETSPWKGCLTTAASEHNNSRISSLLYCPVLEALSGDWEHKGWLFSASSNLLNLWVCSRKPDGQPLELMHSQAITSIVDAMDVDGGAKVLISVGSLSYGRAFAVSIHSLHATNFFEFQGAIKIPERTPLDLLKQVYAGPSKLVHVSSLQPFKGALKTALAVGLGGEVLVYELAAASTVDAIVAPRASWTAHNTAISCMHPSAFGCHLVTGACDGSIKVWDLRSRPGAPVRQCGHQKQVTGLAMLDSNTLCSSGTDGLLNFWDFRIAKGSFASIVPDGKPVLNLASAFSTPKLISFTTQHSLYCLEFCGPQGMTTMLSPVRPLPVAGPCTDVKWNTNCKHFYGAGMDGSISVFKNAGSSS